jgi:transcriptional regulator with XRE-family HTH domain
MTTQRQQGRPAGLLCNTEAVRYVLNGQPQSWLAKRSGVSPGGLSEILAGSKGCTRETANQIADALEVPVGVLFPELVAFRTQVRHFTAPKFEEAA